MMSARKYYLAICLIVSSLAVFCYEVTPANASNGSFSEVNIENQEQEFSHNHIVTDANSLSDIDLDTLEDSSVSIPSKPRRIIFGPDNRRVVSNTSVMPYSAICHLRLHFNDGQKEIIKVGTGSLIAADKVLTSAHCVNDPIVGKVKFVEVFPGYKNGKAIFGRAVSSQIVEYPGWAHNYNKENDLAVITINQPLGKDAGILGFTTDFSPKARLLLAGFPVNNGLVGTMYSMYGIPEAVDSNLVYYKIDTQGGQSGSGLLDGWNRIVAVHRGYTDDATNNNAVRINSQKLTWIKSQLQNSYQVYRLYNSNSGEHFYTSDFTEAKNLVSVGWRYENVAWLSPQGGKPVYRLYNPNAGDHHYTTSVSERENLTKAGWKYEKVSFYSMQSGGFEVYRLYNPNAKPGAHHFTLSSKERDGLVKIGWRYEDVAFRVAG